MIGGYFANYSTINGGAEASKELFQEFMMARLDGGGRKSKKELHKNNSIDSNNNAKKKNDKIGHPDDNKKIIKEKFAIGTINRTELRKSVPRD